MRKLFLLIVSLIMMITPVSAGEIQIDINDDVSLSPDDTFSLSTSLDFPELQNYTEEIKKTIERETLDDLTLDESTLNIIVKIKIPKDSLIHSKEWKSEGCDNFKIGPSFNQEEIRVRIYKENISSFTELEEALNQISEIKLYLENISLQAPTKRKEKLEITGEVNIEYSSVARYKGIIEFDSFEEMNSRLGNYNGNSFENVDGKWVLTYKNEYPIKITATAEKDAEQTIGEQFSTRTIHVLKDGKEIKTIIQKSILKDYEVFFPAYSLEIDNEIYDFEEFRDKKQNIEETIELETSEESAEEVDEEPIEETEELSEEESENTSETKIEEKNDTEGQETNESSEKEDGIENEQEEIEAPEIEEYIIRTYSVGDKALFRKVLTPEETYQYAEGYSIEFNDEITYYGIFNEELLTSNKMEFKSIKLAPEEVYEESIEKLPTASEKPKYADITDIMVDVSVKEVVEPSKEKVVTPVVVENPIEAPEIVYATKSERVLPTQKREVKQIVDTNDTTRLELYLFLLVINLGIGGGVLWLKNKEF